MRDVNVVRAALRLGLAMVAMLGIAGCGKPDTAAKAPPEVGYTVVRPTSITITSELPGRTSALATAEVRPQASGVIERRLFTEGALVHRGQPLYQIDASLYRAAAGQARANLASAQASAEAARAKADRYKPLAADQAVSQQDYTDAAAAARVSSASVAQNQAALSTARINLRFTTVPAPVTGRIGRSLVTEGALATTGQVGPLAVIAVLDPINVDIEQNVEDMLALRRQLASGGAARLSLPVKLILADGSTYNHDGTLEFSEVTVDPATGTVALRARFPNAEGLLLPGMFVRAVLSPARQNNVFLVPQVALTRDPRGNATVFVLDSGGHAMLRNVIASRSQGAFWVVSQGLARGDKVITQGLGKLKPGLAVHAQPDTTPQAPRDTGKR